MVNWNEKVEYERDERDEENIEWIRADLNRSLKDHQEFYIQEALKGVDVYQDNFSKQIAQSLKDVVLADEHNCLETVNMYKEYKQSARKIDRALDLYVDDLYAIMRGTISIAQADSMIISYIGFLQRKEGLLLSGEINKDTSDIDNFINMMKKTISGDAMLINIKNFLERVFPSDLESKKIDTKTNIKKILTKNVVRFPSSKNLTSQERSDLQYIKDDLSLIMWTTTKEEFLFDFFDKMKKQDSFTLLEIDDIVLSLMKKYDVRGNEEDVQITLSDYMQRLRSIMSKKK